MPPKPAPPPVDVTVKFRASPEYAAWIESVSALEAAGTGTMPSVGSLIARALRTHANVCGYDPPPARLSPVSYSQESAAACEVEGTPLHIPRSYSEVECLECGATYPAEKAHLVDVGGTGCARCND